MRKFIEVVNIYCQKATWKDLAQCCACMLALGVFIGMFVSEGIMEPLKVVSAVVFGVTYIMVMGKYFRVRHDYLAGGKKK